MEAVRWLLRRESAKFGKELSIADLLRLAVAHLYQAEQAAVAAEQSPAKPAPAP